MKSELVKIKIIRMSHTGDVFNVIANCHRFGEWKDNEENKITQNLEENQCN